MQCTGVGNEATYLHINLGLIRSAKVAIVVRKYFERFCVWCDCVVFVCFPGLSHVIIIVRFLL